jgi:hypothetical protein
MKPGTSSTFEKEAKTIDELNYDSNKTLVLGSEAPALFFQSLSQLKKYETRKEWQIEMLSDWIYRYCVFQKEEIKEGDRKKTVPKL